MPTLAGTVGICNQPCARRPRDPGVGLGPWLQRQIPRPGSAHPPSLPGRSQRTEESATRPVTCTESGLQGTRQGHQVTSVSGQADRLGGSQGPPQHPEGLKGFLTETSAGLSSSSGCRLLPLTPAAVCTGRSCALGTRTALTGGQRGEELCWEHRGRPRRAAPKAWGRKQGGWGRGAQRSRRERGRSWRRGR